MGLFVRDHLQTVLDDAQETIGGAEFVARLHVNPVTIGQCVEGRQRRFDAQLGMAAARDQLLRLHEKFDLTDTAAAELDVVPFDHNLIMPTIGVNLPFQRVDIRHRHEIEIFPPNER